MSDPLRPFTAEWAAAFRDAINADPAYAAAGKGWTWPIALSLVADPARGYPEDVAIELALSGGHCAGATLTTGGRATSEFVLRGDYESWQSVVRGDVDPIVAVATGKVRLVQGSLTTLMLNTAGAKALLACAQRVPTAF